jgi:GNAT superfamily N-acetyltransferase
MIIKIRKTKEEDCRRVAHVHRFSIRKLCGPSYSQDVIDSWAGGSTADGVRRSLPRKDLNNIVAEVDGVICGIGASVNNRIWLVYVHPKWVDHGVGAKILKRLENDMFKKKIKNITLESSLNAYNFYLRNGYSKVKKKTLQFRNGVRVPCIEMKKKLR